MYHKELRVSCHHLLEEGVKKLDLPIGIVSHIYNGLYTIIAINNEVSELVTGSVFPLNDTYCREVFEKGKTIAITEINGVPGMKLHPLYVQLPLEAYIAAPILHEDHVWGTVNFSSSTSHKPFTDEDRALVESYASAISTWIDTMGAPPKRSSHRTHVASRAPFRAKRKRKTQA